MRGRNPARSVTHTAKRQTLFHTKMATGRDPSLFDPDHFCLYPSLPLFLSFLHLFFSYYVSLCLDLFLLLRSLRLSFYHSFSEQFLPRHLSHCTFQKP